MSASEINTDPQRTPVGLHPITPSPPRPVTASPSSVLKPVAKRNAGGALQRTASVARKELLHIIRDRATLMMTLFFPIVEMIMLGYAIDTNVRFIPTAVLDQAKTQESRSLLRSFENSEDFKIVERVSTEQELTEAIVSGRCRVGIKIP